MVGRIAFFSKGPVAVEPHRIRLREPWDREPNGSRGFRLRRHFNRPTIVVGEFVSLVCEGATIDGTILLNGAPLGRISPGATPWSCDITEQLLSRNEIVVETSAAPVAAELPWKEFRLEVRTD